MVGRLALVLLCAGPVAAGVFADVPFDHWAYGVVEELTGLVGLESVEPGPYTDVQPMTRYEFAVATQRAYQKLKALPKPPPRAASLVLELVREYRFELARMGQKPQAMRLELLRLGAGTSTWVPVPDDWRDAGAVTRRDRLTNALGCPFPLGVYWPIERLPWVAKQARQDEVVLEADLLKRLATDYHCNTVWAVNGGTKLWQRMLTVADDLPLSLLLTPEQVIWARDDHGAEAATKAADTAITALGGHLSLGGYVLIDEARTPEMGHMEALRRAFARWDPARPSLLVTMARDTAAAAERTGGLVLCTDPYPFFGPRSPNGPNTPEASRRYYRDVVQGLVRLARERGKTPWVMPQVFADPWGPWHYDAAGNVAIEPGAYHHWRQPTVGETRWQIWSAVAEGAKGIFFYVLFPPANDRQAGDPFKAPDMPADWPRLSEALATGQGAALLKPNGQPTPEMLAVAEAFRVLGDHGTLLAGLEPAPPVVWAEPPVTVRTWAEPGDGARYLTLVNDDTDHAVTARLHPYFALDAADDLRAHQGVTMSADVLEVKLAPGDGTVLRLGGQRGVRELWREDFAVPATPLQLDQLQVTTVAAPWGLGWRRRLVATDRPGTATLRLEAVAGKQRHPMVLTVESELSGGEAVALEAQTGDGPWSPLTAAGPGVYRLGPEVTVVRLTLPKQGAVTQLALCEAR